MRTASSAFVVEGAKSIGVALDAGHVPESLYLSPEALNDPPVATVADRAHHCGSSVFTLSPGVLERVSDTVTPQPVLAVVRMLDVSLDTALDSSPTGTLPGGPDPLVVVCVDVRDPGNAGNIMRSAAGAGASGMVFCDGTVDPYNPKTVRASAGALFQIPLVAGGAPEAVLAALHGAGFSRIGAVAHGGDDYANCDLTGRIAIVLGNEGSGFDPAVTGCLDRQVTIPLSPGVESLNVGTAAAILCFEAGRQRRAQAIPHGPSRVSGAA